MMRTVAGDSASLGLRPEGIRTGIVGMWIALGSILMLFTALTSAYVVSSGRPQDWRPLWMPPLLWVSTALILASSASIEVARRALKKGSEQGYRRALLLTVLLGIGFLATQVMAWRQLVAQGIYLDSNPHSSFFYVLTGVHGLHLLGGILALDYLLLRNWRPRRSSSGNALAQEKRQTAVDVVALYWHFMDGLWVYLFLLLFFWR
jgi:cytochrome c oxidase subunit 3